MFYQLSVHQQHSAQQIMAKQSGKIKFVRGWTSLNENITSKLTFNVKMLLENRLRVRKLNCLEKLVELHTKTFFCVHKFDYKVSKALEDMPGHESLGRTLDFLDTIFVSKDGYLHHISIIGQEQENGNQNEAIFYDSSDNEEM